MYLLGFRIVLLSDHLGNVKIIIKIYRFGNGREIHFQISSGTNNSFSFDEIQCITDINYKILFINYFENSHEL